jgi:DNA-binding IclR family transcriptional regulator
VSASGAGGGKTPGASSARKLIATLLSFTADRPTPTIADLATAVGVPGSTMYRYVALLRETGLVEALGDGRYRLTDAIVGLNAAADAGRTTLIEAAHPHLITLRDSVDETVLLARRGGDHAYCVAREESSHPVRLQFAVGQAMPLHSGSVARTLLAAMPPSERSDYVSQHLDEVDIDRAALLTPAALDAVLAAGWTQSYEEVDTGIWGCAAEIRVDGQVVAALGTAGPIHRLDAGRRDDVINQVRATARMIGEALSNS